MGQGVDLEKDKFANRHFFLMHVLQERGVCMETNRITQFFSAIFQKKKKKVLKNKLFVLIILINNWK